MRGARLWAIVPCLLAGVSGDAVGQDFLAAAGAQLLPLVVTAATPAAEPDTVVPRAAQLTDTTALQAAVRAGDAWGVSRNGALAVGEILLVNGLVWAFNEYPRGANFTQVNPRSWYNNIKGGWKWDDNHFATNMFAHPYHGNLYYNTARSNGFTFWESIPFAFLGSAFWECCGETHKPAINDWMSTSIGGSTIGEALYRLSSTVLDNEATGASRAWREIGAGVLNPVRGFTRLVTGRAWEVAPNPERPADHVPSRLEHTMVIGVRSVFDDNPVESDSLISGYVLFDFQFGNPFAPEARKPFDWFRLELQLNSRDKERLGRFQIRGMLASTTLRRSASNSLILGASLNYDYINNQAMEFGGQSVTGSLASVWPLSSKFSLIGELGADAQIFGAVNSEFAFIVETPGQERLREYDFGVGGGGRVGLTLRMRGREFVALRYRALYLPALNGAVGTLPGIGDINAKHFLQSFSAELKVPVFRQFGAGADFEWYRRKSDMQNQNLNDIVQRVREVRLYGSWALSLSGVD